MQNVSRFKPEYITNALLVVVCSILVLTLFAGLATIKETITYALIVVLLSFLTADMKRHAKEKRPSSIKNKYVVLMLLFAYITVL
ncbi:hypothetical protein [Halobacillus salinus]|uniref:Uncharacterized protein n=1 Tax=Halobacillus salinus TaxID=192814 RepID=A0A4Z0GZU2_9BACI|nr:hypothetical protein [Halobacillus salinus]TGB03698.1 hypothetical protein E4663_01460 [Halobacillus salinus]